MIIMKPFTLPYFVMLLLTAAASVLLHRLLRSKSEEVKRKTLLIICAVNFAAFFVYKGILSADESYLAILGGNHFDWLREFPLQLCNMNLYLLPISIISKKKPFILFTFSTATLGALAALSFPTLGFSGYPLFLPRILGFNIIHCVLIVCAVNLISLGFYRPRFKDIPAALVILFIVGLAVHGINLLLRALGSDANYLYTIEPTNGALELFWNFVPLSFAYLLIPSYLLLTVYLLLLCLGFRLTGKRGADGAAHKQ